MSEDISADRTTRTSLDTREAKSTSLSLSNATQAPPFIQPQLQSQCEMDELTIHLAAMFPSLERDTIRDVLASRSGDADAAVPLLLMLSGQEAASGTGIDSVSGLCVFWQ